MNRSRLPHFVLFFLAFAPMAIAQDLDWQTDVDLAKNMAAKEGKLVMLHFTAQWCRPCKQLNTFVFASPSVIGAINERFVPVLVDTDKNPDLVKQYDVESIPLDIVITPNGRMIQKRQSPKDATNFVRMVKAVDHADTQYAYRNAEISKKIGAVLEDVKQGAKSKITENNDFVASGPVSSAPAPGIESKQLLAKSKTRLVDHVSEVQTGQATIKQRVRPTQGPQRVINDSFFAEKSNTGQATVSSAAITPAQPQPSPQAQSPALHPAEAQLVTPSKIALDSLSPASASQNPTVTSEQPQATAPPQSSQAKASIVESAPERQLMGTPGGAFVPATPNDAAQKPVAIAEQKPTPVAKLQTVETAESKTAAVQSKARVLQKVEEVPGKIEVDSVRANLANKNAVDGSKVRAKIVSNETNSDDPAGAHSNSLRSSSISIPDLIAGRDLRDSVQQMFAIEKQQPADIPLRPYSKIGLGGKCPVTLIKNAKWVPGDKKFGCVHRGKTYLFADAEKQAEFQQEPEKYSPVLAGFDPVVFHTRGELLEGDAKHGVFMGKAPNHRIVLFATQESRDEFQANPKKFMATVRLAIQQSDSMR